MKTTACMGGWCRKRAGCAHYLAEDRRDPVERLCVDGADGLGRNALVVVRRVGEWELPTNLAALMARAHPFEVTE